MEIRSYRRVFDLERRIYRVDRLRLNPNGVPLRGIVYFLAAVAAALTARQLPLLASLARTLPWYLSDIVVPACGAALLCVIRIEGRPFHLAAAAIARYCAGDRWLSGLARGTAPGERWHAPPIVLLPDGSDSRMRRLRYSGPGAVLIAVEHQLLIAPTRAGVHRALRSRRRRTELSLREREGGRRLAEGRVIALAPRSQLVVRASSPVGGRRR
ncbi:MAG TPA: hypothetical protein VHY83_12920 [Solirubrobacteraceae bacterium]|jgi:hypothetical protein|nr:hypothetical protein [Solirubrobacteraceae bacterium]